MKHRILFLAANTPGTGRVALDQEARDIEVELERSGWRDHFELVTRWAAEPLDLLRELRKIRPTVLHFSGHGGAGGRDGMTGAVAATGSRDVVEAADPAAAHGLYFHDAAGGVGFVPVEAIAQTLEAAGPSVRLVVLNACYTAPIATALLAHVDGVVGMNSVIRDAAARNFSIGFYGGLGESQSIGAAFRQGCAAINLYGLADADQPRLQVRDGSAAGELILADVAPLHAPAGATLTGMVSLHREHGTPISGVAISAVGASQTVSGDDGAFVLSFPQGYPGQDVRLRVNRPGWDVVNAILLDQRLPDDPDARPLEIILCPSDERERWVADFYRIKGAQAVEETYKAKLEALEQQNAATAQERDLLLRKLDGARKQVDEWARQAAAYKPEEVGGTYREALRLFIDGKTDAALQLLSDDRLQREADQAKEQFEQAKKQLDQVVQGWLLKGQLLTSKFDYGGAERAYEKAVTFAPGSIVAWFAYANFCRQQNHFAQARRSYEQALALARVASNNAVVAGILNSLGGLSLAERRTAEARLQYEEALTLYRELTNVNREVFLPHIAKILNNLGVLSRYENRDVAARQLYEEALAIRRGLAKMDPAAYLPGVAETLNNLGILSSNENSNAEARQQFEQALALYRELANTDQVYLPYVAATLHNMGNLSRAENSNAEARLQYQETLDIRRGLAQTNPAAYMPIVAQTLITFGLLNQAENRNAEARKHYEDALGIFRQFAALAPSTYQPRVEQLEQLIRELP